MAAIATACLWVCLFCLLPHETHEGEPSQVATMPEGFAYLKLRATTRKGIPTSDYKVHFEKHNTGNIAVHVELTRLRNLDATRGELGYRYVPPTGVMFEDERSREGFSQIVGPVDLGVQPKVTKVLLHEKQAFFSLGYHRLEIWWRSSNTRNWKKAGAIIFEIVW